MKINLPLHIKSLTLIIVFLMAFLLFPKFALASTLYLSPASGNITIGGTLSVQVRLNAGGDAVNGVSAFLSYPQDKLDVAWVSGGAAFGIEAEKSYGGGIIKISRGNFSGVTGNVGVATIGFRGKAAGSATVAFIGGSQAPRASDSSDSLNLGGSRGGVYNVGGTAPKVTKAPVKGVKSAEAEKPKDNSLAQLLISQLQINNISTNSATISWKTNGEADSTIEYGLEKDKYFLSATDAALAIDHSLKLENPILVPGLKLHFRVKSKDNLGHEAGGEDQELQLKGYRVKIKMVDDNSKPLSGVEVFLYSDPLRGFTNANGEVVFENVTAGKHLAVAKIDGVEKSLEINVSPDIEGTFQASSASTTSAQPVTAVAGTANTFTINIHVPASKKLQSVSPLFIVIPVVAAILLLAVILIIIKKRGKNQGGKPINTPVSAPNTQNTGSTG